VPFREGDEVLVHIVEPHMYDVDDAVAKIDGYIISVAGGGRHVGNKRLVRIEHAGRTSATAIMLDAPEPPGVAEVVKPSRPARTAAKAPAKAAVKAAAKAEEKEDAPAELQTPQDPAEGEEVESTPRRRGRRGGRRRSRATADTGAAGESSSASPSES